MNASPSSSAIDFGRLLVVPIFAALLFSSVLRICTYTQGDVAVLIHLVLVSLFNVLLITLYFLRTPPILTSQSLATNAIATIAAFLPFLLSVLPRPAENNAGLTTVANAIALPALLFASYAIASLGRSFSIIPQARALVRSGPYRFVRHPLYLAELLAMFGLVLGSLTAARVIALLLAALCQVYRAIQEERLLGEVFPEYDDYSEQTARFIPGVY